MSILLSARRVLGLAAAGALLVGATGCSVPGFGSDTKHFSASFDRAIGVYVHSDVRVLGVKIGQVTKITPNGKSVKLDMEYDASYKIPADAQAVIFAPSIVSDRYVQLTPVWRQGPTLADGTALGLDRTAAPVELDNIYASLDTLNQSLGPDGANKNGALSDLLHVSAQNLGGNGQALNSSLSGLSKAVQTLADSRADLFGTITNLQDFTTTLAKSDSTVRAFNENLAKVAAQLDGERTDLATAVKQLSVALGEVSSFVQQNKKDLTANVTDLASVTKVLVNQKRALKEFIDVAPTALSNLQLAYNPNSGTLDTRLNGGQSLGGLCSLLGTAGVPDATCQTLVGRLGGGLPTLPVAPPALPLGSRSSATRTGSVQPAGLVNVSTGTTTASDPTLGGILRSSR